MTPLAKVEKHIHKLRRHTYKSGTAVYFCALDCSYKTSVALAFGKKTICWRCNNPFSMNEYSMRLAKPHCESCHKPKMINQIEDKATEKEVVVTGITPEMSLADRLSMTLAAAQHKEEEMDI